MHSHGVARDGQVYLFRLGVRTSRGCRSSFYGLLLLIGCSGSQDSFEMAGNANMIQTRGPDHERSDLVIFSFVGLKKIFFWWQALILSDIHPPIHISDR
jgi:hypothetical protein